jgi:hypothetical protein
LSDNSTRAKFIIVAVLFVCVLVTCGKFSGTPAPSTQLTAETDATRAKAAAEIASKQQSQACSSEWRKCLSNHQMAGNWKGWVSAIQECQYSTNLQARFGAPEWPWFAFMNNIDGSDWIAAGKATLSETVQFRNAFGTMVPTAVTCLYDLDGRRVVDVTIWR